MIARDTKTPPFFKAVFLVVAGTAVSAVVYPLTHGKHKRLPELYGIASGYLLGIAGIVWLFLDTDAAFKSFVSGGLVGVGVALNRAILELMAQNGHGV